jgi:hypothetical protein
MTRRIGMVIAVVRVRAHYAHLLVIGAMVALGQPCRFSIWHSANFGAATIERTFLAVDITDLEALILWSFEDLVTMQTVKGVSRVLTGWRRLTTR